MGYISALRSHTGSAFSCPFTFLVDCSLWMHLLRPWWRDLFETVPLEYSPSQSSLQVCSRKLLFYHCLIVEQSHYFNILLLISWLVFLTLSVSYCRNCLKCGVLLISIILKTLCQYFFNPKMEIPKTHEIILFRLMLYVIILLFGAAHSFAFFVA